MKVSELLKAALAKLGPNGEHWTQGKYAKRADGTATSNVTEAVCFCGLGALRAVAFGQIEIGPTQPVGDYVVAKELLTDEVGRASGWYDYPAYNDQPYRTFPTIRKVFNNAIALVEVQEQAAA